MATKTDGMKKTCNSAFTPLKGQKKRLWFVRGISQISFGKSVCQMILRKKNSADSARNRPKVGRGREGESENRETQQGRKASRHR